MLPDLLDSESLEYLLEMALCHQSFRELSQELFQTYPGCALFLLPELVQVPLKARERLFKVRKRDPGRRCHWPTGTGRIPGPRAAAVINGQARGVDRRCDVFFHNEALYSPV